MRICSRLSVAAQHDDHPQQVEERRRHEQDPAEWSQRRHREDVRHVGEQVGETDSSAHGQPHGILRPAPERDRLRERERGPLAGGATQERVFKTGRNAGVENPKPDLRSEPGQHEDDGILHQSRPEVNNNDGFESAVNHLASRVFTKTHEVGWVRWAYLPHPPYLPRPARFGEQSIKYTDRGAAMPPSTPTSHPPDCEYLVVGSGAGGGTLAARLAEAGRRVILLEAGGDPRELSGGDPVQPHANRLPHDYDVPAFHGFASENSAIAWNFFVRHYADDAVQRRDPKFVETHAGSRVDGVYYPRAGTLGGCTAHNAMIFVYPHNADWDGIAQLTGDASWSSAAMRRYFERIENCRHRPVHRWLAKLGLNPTRHGWNGWLPTEKMIPRAVIGDRQLTRVIIDSAFEAFMDGRPPNGSGALVSSEPVRSERLAAGAGRCHRRSLSAVDAPTATGARARANACSTSRAAIQIA